MVEFKLEAGSKFPEIEVPLVGGGNTILGASSAPDRWKLVVVYRGFIVHYVQNILTNWKS
nr:hypothetical protein [Sneathiella glossodoripedis]